MIGFREEDFPASDSSATHDLEAHEYSASKVAGTYFSARIISSSRTKTNISEADYIRSTSFVNSFGRFYSRVAHHTWRL